MVFQFSEKEIQAVKARFPKLELVQSKVWEGDLDLFATYNDVEIQDLYKISITVPSAYPNEIPLLREIGGRTQEIANKWGLMDLRTLHHNPENGTACLCVKQEESERFPSGSDLVKFIDELVVPYLYGLSSYEERREWPWKEYDHGGLGLLAYEGEKLGNHTRETIVAIMRSIFLDQRNWARYRQQLRQPKGHCSCLCGSRIPLYACHKKVWAGIQHLHECMARLGMSSMSLVLEVEGARSKK